MNLKGTDPEPRTHMFKFIIIGDSGVGKSSLMLRFTDDAFTDSFIMTIGVDFRIKTINYNGQEVKIQIWDTAGQERFMAITPAYYHSADGVLLCYDVTDRKSFDHIERWIADLDSYHGDGACRIVIGNKTDLDTQRTVTPEEGHRLAERFSSIFIETSAKTATNVETAFLTLVQKLINDRMKPADPQPDDRNRILGREPSRRRVRSGCC